MHKLKIVIMTMAFVVGLVAALVFLKPAQSTLENKTDIFEDTSAEVLNVDLIVVTDIPSEKDVKVIDYVHAPVPDFSQFTQIQDKKKGFFDYLIPVAQAQNDYIKNVRLYIKALQQTYMMGLEFSSEQQQEFEWLTKEYRVNTEQPFDNIFAELLRKIDIIPIELVLAQTANESGWGTSRFAVDGYNFFGLWCFRKGCGFVPSRRSDDAQHEVAKFNDLSSAMYSYMRNLNRHPAYKEMRTIRENYRINEQTIAAYSLARGLTSYSQRGEEYIDELHSMMRVNEDLIAP